MDAPHTLENNPFAKETDSDQPSEPAKKWWGVQPGHNYSNATKYEGIEASIQRIEEIFKLHGPFDGILGFSQGATMAAVMCQLLHSGKCSPETSFKFAIFISAFPPTPEEFRITSVEKNFSSVHIYGLEDERIPAKASQSLSEQFDSPIVFEHPNGHYIPTSKMFHPNWIFAFQQLHQEIFGVEESKSSSS